jgi:hypothetical protein
MNIDNLVARGDFASVVCVGDVAGQNRALQSILKTGSTRFRSPFWIFMGDLVDGPETAAVIKSVLQLCSSAKAICLASNHDTCFLDDLKADKSPNRQHQSVIDLIGRDRCIEFLENLPEWISFDRYFLSHAAVGRYPLPGWISSSDPRDLTLSAFAQAVRAQYDFRGLMAHGQFQPEEILHERGKIGVCGHEELEGLAALPGYICVDSGIAVGRTLTALDLISMRYIQSDQAGEIVTDEVLRIED